MSYSSEFLNETKMILDALDLSQVEELVSRLAQIRDVGGRLFLLGVGGSAGSASHAVNDFRKLCGFEAYCPTDNVSEITARTNDEGFETVFEEYLKGSKLTNKDALLIFSVGGGDLEKNISANLVRAIQYAQKIGAAVFGVLGRDGGYTARSSDVHVLIPTVNPAHVTPHTEAFHGVIWHLLVSHPVLQKMPTKWESAK